MSGRGNAIIGDATTSQNAERWRHVNRMNCEGGATRGNATISWHVERWLHVKRMGGEGGTTRSNATTSRGKQKANGRSSETALCPLLP